MKILLSLFILISHTLGFCQISGQPANSYVSGQNWYCVEGYQKAGNSCVSIFANFPNGKPANSYVSGQNWYCVEGYQKAGNSCVSIFANFPNGKPANSYVSGQNWYCVEGYRKDNNACVNIFTLEENALNQIKDTKPIFNQEKKIIDTQDSFNKNNSQFKKLKNYNGAPISGGLPPIKQ